MGKIKELIQKILGVFKNQKKLPIAKEDRFEILEAGKQAREQKENAEKMVKDMEKTFKEKIAEAAKPSKLDPKAYSSNEDICMAILEDMGLNEQFKSNPRAREDLYNLVKETISKK